MEVKVCKNCRKLFNYIYGPELCPKCMTLVNDEKLSPKRRSPGSFFKPLMKEEEEKYEQVRDYVINNPKATVAQVAEVHNISPSKIFEWIKDERLEFSEDSKYAWFECEICGTKIKSGRLCPRCKLNRKR